MPVGPQRRGPESFGFTPNNPGLRPGGPPPPGGIPPVNPPAPPPPPVVPTPGFSNRTTNYNDLRTNHPGYVRPPDSPNGRNNPEITLSDLTKRAQARFDYFYKPVQQSVINSLGKSNVQPIKQGTAQGFARMRQKAHRQQSRYGITRTPLEKREFDRRVKREKTLGVGSATNEARLDEKQRNDNLRREMINIGRGVASTATDTFADSAGLHAQREANNNAADAQAKASRNQTYSAVGTMIANMIIQAYF